MAYRRISSQVLFGTLIVLVGAVLLANTTRLYDTGFLLDYVPSLFVLVGLYALAVSGFRNLVGPLTVVLVAGAWQLVAIDVVAASDLVVFWPVLVIAFGLSVLAGRMRSRLSPVDDARVDLFAMFGGNERRATAPEFLGGDLTALFGGVELDLRDTAVTTPPARINATALFGGVEIVVPREWNVRMDVLPIFGGADDDRPRREEEHGEVDLVVTGFAAFGGVAVTD